MTKLEIKMNNSTHKFKKFNLYRRKLKLTCSFLYKFSSLTSSGVLFKVLATCSIIDSIIKTAWLEPWTKYKKKVLLNCNIIETSPSLFSPAVKMIKVSNQFEVINLTKCKLPGNNCNWICFFDPLVLLQHVE